jgi:hypothetical protein
MHSLPLFAQFAFEVQSTARGSQDTDGAYFIPRMLMVAAVVGVGIGIPILLLAWRKAKMSHLERMKAMELGHLPIPSQGPLALYCGVVGAGVPIGTFLITWMASQSHRVPNDIWVAPSIVSVVALIGVSIVAGTGFARSNASAEPQSKTKPAHDPDAVDFAGRFHRH